MGFDSIPEDVEEFIRRRIDSVAQLEALLMTRSAPQAEWSVAVLAKRLYVSEKQAADLMARLFTDGFLIKAGSSSLYQYQPDSDELRQLVDRVAESYSKHLVPITNLIHSKPQTRVREFADAFKLRRDE